MSEIAKTITVEQLIINKYKNGKSTYEISEELTKVGVAGYYPNKINRLLKKHGVPRRSREESQRLVLESGRAKHPTKGTKRPANVRAKISSSVAATYQSDPVNKENRSKLSKELWDKTSTAQRYLLQKKAAKAIRRSATYGSKIERYLQMELTRAGFVVQMHRQDLIYNNKLQIDLFLPGISTCIEIDGLSHFEPIWGDEAFGRMKLADSAKNGLILNYFNLIRVQALAKKVTASYCRKTFDRLFDKIQFIHKRIKETGFLLLPLEERFIILKEDEVHGTT